MTTMIVLQKLVGLNYIYESVLIMHMLFHELQLGHSNEVYFTMNHHLNTSSFLGL